MAKVPRNKGRYIERKDSRTGEPTGAYQVRYPLGFSVVTARYEEYCEEVDSKEDAIAAIIEIGLRVLLALGERNGSLGQSEISRFLVLRKSKVTEACQGLQASGLIDRKPMPLDRRNSIAVATQAGEKLTSAIIASIASESENYIRPVAQGEIGFYVEVARITMGSLRMNRKRMQL